MYKPEVWTLMIGLLGLVLWAVFGVPLYWTVAIGVATAVVVSTTYLGIKHGTDRRLSERLKNATEDDVRLPDGFLFGAATAAHQIEGDQHNDWTEWEQAHNFEPSGIACDALHLFDHDIKRMQWLGLDVYRFSVEWSRVEPQPGQWNQEAVDMYAGMCRKLRAAGIQPLVTMHHFTSPVWVAGHGGFENGSVVDHFVEFCRRIADATKDSTTYYVTFNEPSLYALNSCVTGERPGDRVYSRKGDLQAMCRMMRNLVNAHAEAYHAIHAVHPQAKVSIAKNVIHFEPRNKLNPIDCFLTHEIDRVYNHAMLDAMSTGEYDVSFASRFVMKPIKEKNPRWARTMDYLGLNHYNISTVGLDFSQPQLVVVDQRRVATDNPKNQMQWEMEPASMLYAARKVQRYNQPIFVTESGCCDDGGDADHRRQQFMLQSLACITQAIEENIPFLGFCQWSLIDNFEWDSGFEPRFGLFRVNYHKVRKQYDEKAWEDPEFEDESRAPTGSAHLYRRLITNNKSVDAWTENHIPASTERSPVVVPSTPNVDVSSSSRRSRRAHHQPDDHMEIEME